MCCVRRADIAWGQICILVCQMKDIHEIPNTGATEEQTKNEDEKKKKTISSFHTNLLSK